MNAVAGGCKASVEACMGLSTDVTARVSLCTSVRCIMEMWDATNGHGAFLFIYYSLVCRILNGSETIIG